MSIKELVEGMVKKNEDTITNAVMTNITNTIRRQPGGVVNKGDLIKLLNKYIPRVSGPKTTTKLALGAVDQLEKANTNVVKEAITTIMNKKISGSSLMDYLDDRLNRKAFTEVVSELAAGWSVNTVKAFTQVLQMEQSKHDVMDSIISTAILNDPDLENEVRLENMPETSDEDLLEDRKIIWQHPEPGTPLDPPYVVLVAVEHEDTSMMEEVVESIMDVLGNYKGFRLPKSAISRLTKGAQYAKAKNIGEIILTKTGKAATMRRAVPAGGLRGVAERAGITGSQGSESTGTGRKGSVFTRTGRF